MSNKIDLVFRIQKKYSVNVGTSVNCLRCMFLLTLKENLSVFTKIMYLLSTFNVCKSTLVLRGPWVITIFVRMYIKILINVLVLLRRIPLFITFSLSLLKDNLHLEFLGLTASTFSFPLFFYPFIRIL